MAELASDPLEVVEPADVSSEVAELMSGLLEAVEPVDISSEMAAYESTQLPRRRCLLTLLPSRAANRLTVSGSK